MEALYFPFLRLKTDSVKKIQPSFSELFSLSFQGFDAGFGENTAKIYPVDFDPSFFETVSGVLEEKLAFSGRDSLNFLFSENAETPPTLSTLADDIRGKGEGRKKKEFPKKEKLYLAAMILSQAEELDTLNEELERDFLDIEKARESLLFELTGEVQGRKREKRGFFPEHLEIRMRAWLILLAHCRNVPDFWITDMPDAEKILEKIFPEAEKKLLPPELNVLGAFLEKKESAFFYEVPTNAAGLFKISFAGKAEKLKILCFECFS